MRFIVGAPDSRGSCDVGSCSAWRCRAVKELQRRRIQFADDVADWQEVRWKAEELHELRPEQLQAVDAWMEAGQAGCVVMPTGTGKTEVALSIMQRTKVATLIVSPVRDLMYQWHRRILRCLSYDAGIIGDNVFRDPIGRFPHIEEDEPPLHLLVGDY